MDEFLEENLDSGLSFSTTFGQMQSYDTSIEEKSKMEAAQQNIP